jgi:hypothetical protein
MNIPNGDVETVNKINVLSARAVVTITKPGRHADGGGLSRDGGADPLGFDFREDQRRKPT